MSVYSINNCSYNPVTEQIKNDYRIKSSAQQTNYPEKMNLKNISSDNVLAYHTSFSGISDRFKNISKYNTINKYLDKNSKIYFKQLQASGILTNKTSNDNSSVLDNLIKIATTERLEGLSKENILRETVKLLANPYSISQKFGDFPQNIMRQTEQAAKTKIPPEAYYVSSSTCFATSIEFNLIQKQPAEFTRMVEGLTSPSYSIEKHLKVSDISPNFTEALHDLIQFNTEYKIEPDWETLTINLKPDRNAIVRARVQNSYKDEGERSLVDVLMQSMIMNLGSQNSYNSIPDIRTGKLNPDNTGLTNMEGNFASKIIEGKNKISIIYQEFDEEGRLIPNNIDNNVIKEHIGNTLESGNNLIVGYTICNEENKVVIGHEITITGAIMHDDTLYYICNDSDDNYPAPIFIEADKLIPQIHHADFPAEIFSDAEEMAKNRWKYELAAVNEAV